jgi:hypothetical protein
MAYNPFRVKYFVPELCKIVDPKCGLLAVFKVSKLDRPLVAGRLAIVRSRASRQRAIAQEEIVRQFEAGIGFSSNTYSVPNSHEHHLPQNPLCYETLGRTALHISHLYMLARRASLQIGILEMVGVSQLYRKHVRQTPKPQSGLLSCTWVVGLTYRTLPSFSNFRNFIVHEKLRDG